MIEKVVLSGTRTLDLPIFSPDELISHDLSLDLQYMKCFSIRDEYIVVQSNN